MSPKPLTAEEVRREMRDGTPDERTAIVLPAARVLATVEALETARAELAEAEGAYRELFAATQKQGDRAVEERGARIRCQDDFDALKAHHDTARAQVAKLREAVDTAIRQLAGGYGDQCIRIMIRALDETTPDAPQAMPALPVDPEAESRMAKLINAKRVPSVKMVPETEVAAAEKWRDTIFAAVETEREACAAIAVAFSDAAWGDDERAVMQRVADAIRARGSKGGT